MQISDMNKKYDFAQVKKILESRFDWVGRWDEMTESDVQGLKTKVETKLREAKGPTRDLYVFIREAATLRLAEMLNENVGSEAVEGAEVILAAQEIGDKLQDMAEDIAKFQVQDMMPIVTAMKEQFGIEQAQAFEQAAESALAGLLDGVKGAKEAYDNAVLVLQGDAPANDMGADMDADMGADDGFGDMEIDTDDDGEMEPVGDDFSGADAAAGDDEEAGREMKESIDDQIMAALKSVQESTADGKISRADLERIKASIGA